MPWVGSSWEGFVMEQILGTLGARQKSVDPYFFRTSDGWEADLVLDNGKSLSAIEIKLTSQPSERTLCMKPEKCVRI
jgi:predicted AAA+ superfamily ATPase